MGLQAAVPSIDRVCPLYAVISVRSGRSANHRLSRGEAVRVVIHASCARGATASAGDTTARRRRIYSADRRCFDAASDRQFAPASRRHSTSRNSRNGRRRRESTKVVITHAIQRAVQHSAQHAAQCSANRFSDAAAEQFAILPPTDVVDLASDDICAIHALPLPRRHYLQHVAWSLYRLSLFIRFHAISNQKELYTAQKKIFA